MAAGRLVWRKSSADWRDAIDLYYTLTADAPWSFLLESARDGERSGRYSIIGYAPDRILRVQDMQAALAHAPELAKFQDSEQEPLQALRGFIQDAALAIPDELPMLAAGCFGYLGYEMAQAIERLPPPKRDALGVPDALLLRPTRLCIADTQTRDIYMCVAEYSGSGESAPALDKMEAQLAAPSLAPMRSANGATFQPPTSNMSKAEYAAMVERGRDYIIAGDIFQVTLSQRFQTPFPLPGLQFYRSLKRINPSPYLFYWKFPDFSVIGSSPETLVAVEGGEMRLNVIAGTHARGKDAAEDAKISASLLANEKERAEHLMLLDLGRNDIGRVCEIGSVKPHNPFAIQTTSHLLHIASKVTGTLRADCDPLDALLSGFPTGTVAGAPKIRAMEIINELEPVKRGIYAGGVGYFSANGDIDSCIALRTAILKDDVLYVQAGGGIVYDSEPDYEHQECVNKAKALMRAAEDAFAGAT